MTATIRVGAKAIIVRDGQVLLVRYQDETGNHYNFPGGGIDKGESIRKGLRREVFEETNLRVKVGRLLLVAEYRSKKHASGMAVLPVKMRMANATLAFFKRGVYFGWFKPSDWKRLWKPWLRCMESGTIARTYAAAIQALWKLATTMV